MLGEATDSGRVGRDTWIGTLLVPGLKFDVEEPTLSGAANRTVRVRKSLKSTRVVFRVTAQEDRDGSLPVRCDPRPGSRFKLGKTHVTCSATQARIDVPPRIRLSITEAAATDVIESYALLSQDLFERRLLSAQHGISYAICATGGICPYPAPRFARPAADYLPRRLALELAVRTFLETDATLVAVTLPTPHLVAFVVAREDLSHGVDLAKLARALSSRPLLAPSASLRRAVDEFTRPRTYLFLGLEPTPSGGVSWAGMPRWPIVT